MLAVLQVRDIYQLEAPLQLSHHALHSGSPAAAAMADAAAEAAPASVAASPGPAPAPALSELQESVKLQTLARVVELIYARRFRAASDQEWVRQAILDALGPSSLSDPAAMGMGSAVDVSEAGAVRVGCVYMARGSADTHGEAGNSALPARHRSRCS